MKARLFAILALTTAIASCYPAQADTALTFQFTTTHPDYMYQGDYRNVSGWFTIADTPIQVDPMDPLSPITGTTPAYSVTSGGLYYEGTVYNLMPDPYNRALKYESTPLGDQVYYPTAPPDQRLDESGLSFVAANTDRLYIDISASSYLGGPYVLEVFGPTLNSGYGLNVDYDSAGNFTVTPEPNSLVLLSLGALAGTGLLVRRNSLLPA